MARDDYKKARRLFDDEDRGGFAFREVFTPNREGPLPRRPGEPRPPGKGGPSINQGAAPGGATSVWSASDATAGGMTLSNGGLTANGGGQSCTVRGTKSQSSGKWYFEILLGSFTGSIGLGLANSTASVTTYLGDTNYTFGVSSNGAVYVSGFNSAYPTNYSPVAGDVYQFAVNMTVGNVWVNVNNSHSWFTGDPVGATNPIGTFVSATTGPLFPAGGGYLVGGSQTLQPTAASQKYAPPAGFSPWG